MGDKDLNYNDNLKENLNIIVSSMESINDCFKGTISKKDFKIIINEDTSKIVFPESSQEISCRELKEFIQNNKYKSKIYDICENMGPECLKKLEKTLINYETDLKVFKKYTSYRDSNKKD